MAMTDDERVKILIDAGFTSDELREFATLLMFAVTLAEAGERGFVGEGPKLTPAKREALLRYIQEGLSP